MARTIPQIQAEFAAWLDGYLAKHYPTLPLAARSAVQSQSPTLAQAQRAFDHACLTAQSSVLPDIAEVERVAKACCLAWIAALKTYTPPVVPVEPEVPMEPPARATAFGRWHSTTLGTDLVVLEHARDARARERARDKDPTLPVTYAASEVSLLDHIRQGTTPNLFAEWLTWTHAVKTLFPGVLEAAPPAPAAEEQATRYGPLPS